MHHHPSLSAFRDYGDWMSEKNRPGRPYAEIDWDQFDRLCEIQCTGEEIASVLGIDYDTLNAACKREHGEGFSDCFEKRSGVGRASLRRRQHEVAMDGNPTMLIWLGKQRLDQKDVSRREHGLGDDDAEPLTLTFQVNEAKSEVKVTNAKS